MIEKETEYIISLEQFILKYLNEEKETKNEKNFYIWNIFYNLRNSEYIFKLSIWFT